MKRTSFSHPLRIDAVQAGSNAGQLGLTFCPGKKQPHAMTGSWERDLAPDLESIRAWGATHLLTLIEPFEFEELHVPHLGIEAARRGLLWHHLPIVDDSIPNERFLQAWPVVGQSLRQSLTEGQRVVVHCKGGLGRAGTVACMLLLELEPDLTVDEALARVRHARPGAVYVQAQEQFLKQRYSRPAPSSLRP